MVFCLVGIMYLFTVDVDNCIVMHNWIFFLSFFYPLKRSIFSLWVLEVGQFEDKPKLWAGVVNKFNRRILSYLCSDH
jgi:hypothetical protein